MENRQFKVDQTVTLSQKFEVWCIYKNDMIPPDGMRAGNAVVVKVVDDVNKKITVEANVFEFEKWQIKQYVIPMELVD